MKKIDWKIFNFALWIEVVLSYILPFRIIDDFQYRVGFPIPFLSVYNAPIGVSPLTSMSLNFLEFLLNGVIIYLILLFAIRVYQKAKRSNVK
ncbi:MAG TPA: hypothetical protein DD735_08635 [Clostridiales bacterium]|nr:hypothetical protein [Clostridiales bacterium]